MRASDAPCRLGTDILPAGRNVHLFGRRADVARLLSAADFIVSSSAFSEGFSSVLAEGMACRPLPPRRATKRSITVCALPKRECNRHRIDIRQYHAGQELGALKAQEWSVGLRTPRRV